MIRETADSDVTLNQSITTASNRQVNREPSLPHGTAT